MTYRRPDRVGDLIKKEIASMLLHGEIKDPRIGFVTITKVRMTRDLKKASVFFSILGGSEERERSLEGLNSAVPYIRRHLAKRLNLKHIPSVIFLFDRSIEYASHIQQVIEDIKKEGT